MVIDTTNIVRLLTSTIDHVTDVQLTNGCEVLDFSTLAVSVQEAADAGKF